MKGARRTGRPTKLTPEIQDAICNVIQSGCFLETAAIMVGLDKTTLFRWLKRGAKEGSGKFREFRTAIRKAMAHAEVRDLIKLQKAGDKNWQAIAWRLERRYPKRWGRRDPESPGKTSPEESTKLIARFLAAADSMEKPAGETTAPKENPT
jgi:hypothetical protein